MEENEKEDVSGEHTDLQAEVLQEEEEERVPEGGGDNYEELARAIREVISAETPLHAPQFTEEDDEEAEAQGDQQGTAKPHWDRLLKWGIPAIVVLVVFFAALMIHTGRKRAAREEAERREAELMLALTVTPTPTPIPSPTPTPEPVMSETMTTLQTDLEAMTALEGQTWNVYVKNLLNGEEIMTGDEEMYAASLIKLFVLEYWMERTRENPEALDVDVCSRGSLRRLLTDMIEVSDNESYNELVRQAGGGSGEEGFKAINEWIKSCGYSHTGVYHSLHPSSSDPMSISEEKNHTSVSDCALVLEKIYAGAHTGDAQAQFMMSLLEAQSNRTKIVGGLPEGIRSGNKTGETDEVQHDAAIVFGASTDYILVVMGSHYTDEGDAIGEIRKVSTLVYERLNPEGTDLHKKVSERRTRKVTRQ